MNPILCFSTISLLFSCLSDTVESKKDATPSVRPLSKQQISALKAKAHALEAVARRLGEKAQQITALIAKADSGKELKRKDGKQQSERVKRSIFPMRSLLPPFHQLRISPEQRWKAREVAMRMVHMAIHMAMSSSCQRCGMDFLQHALLLHGAPLAGLLGNDALPLVKTAIAVYHNVDSKFPGGAAKMMQEGEKLLHSRGMRNAEKYALNSPGSLSHTMHNGVQNAVTEVKGTSQGIGRTAKKGWNKLTGLFG